MNKKYIVIALLVCLVLLISACKKGGATTGAAPRTPFIGGTAGISMNFEKDSPPPEVTDDTSFAFDAIIRLKNEGETAVDRNNIRVNLIGFDPNDFGKTFSDLRDKQPDDTLQSKKRDSEGNIIEGNPTFVMFPSSGDSFVPKKFSGNTEFTFRAEACYLYQTQANTKLCVLRDMINVNDRSLCKPTAARTLYSSAAPVQITNFRQTVVGKEKISFSFDIVLSGNVDIFFSKSETTPSSNFDSACPSAPRARREVEDQVKVAITEIPEDPIFRNIKCGGLESGFKGTVKLINGKRTLTCTVELVSDRIDLEKTMGINLLYNVRDNKETKILIKHLAEAPP